LEKSRLCLLVQIAVSKGGVGDDADQRVGGHLQRAYALLRR
jgi:hypothetical protein